MAEERSRLDRALAHPVRVELVKLIWHRGDYASATDLQQDVPRHSLATVSYHLRVLEDAEVVEADNRAPDEPARRAYYICGDNADETVQRLGLLR